MAITNGAVFSRWEYHVLNGKPEMSKNGTRVLSTNGSSVLSRGDAIYSYGTHFEMARAVRNSKGTVQYIILNGDRASVTTSSHQASARGYATRMGNELGVPVLIVPYSALESAGVQPDSLDIVEVRPDRNETVFHASEERPGELTEMDEPNGATQVIRETVSGTLDTETGRFVVKISQWGDISPYPEWARGKFAIWGHVTTNDPDEYTIMDESPFSDRPSILNDKDGWQAWGERYKEYHQVGLPRRRPIKVKNPNQCYVGRNHWLYANRDDDGIWRWERIRHWLGDSCFRGKVVERVEVKPTPEQLVAHERLRNVSATAQAHRDYMREEYNIANGYRLYPGDHRVPRSTGMTGDMYHKQDQLDAIVGLARDELDALIPDAVTRGVRYNGVVQGGLHLTRGRTRRPYFLSSFDYGESRPLYFLCELPKGQAPMSIEHAYEMLKPAEVVHAERESISVDRQGDVFAIETNIATAEIRSNLKRGASILKRGKVLGTDHACTETAQVSISGKTLTFGRGCMYHDVSGRERDHARRRMGNGKTWHLLVRNTVPSA